MIKVCVVSGYKPHELGIFGQKHPGIPFLKKAIKQKLLGMLDQGLEWVVITGQLGIELWAAEVVFELQLEGYEHLQLAVFPPFLGQEENWSEQNKEWYESVLAGADFVDYITKRPYENPSQFSLKNQFLLQKSDGLILLYDQENEGSPKYLYDLAKKYQASYPYEIRNIDLFEIQEIIEEEQMKSTDF